MHESMGAIPIQSTTKSIHQKLFEIKSSNYRTNHASFLRVYKRKISMIKYGGNLLRGKGEQCMQQFPRQEQRKSVK